MADSILVSHPARNTAVVHSSVPSPVPTERVSVAKNDPIASATTPAAPASAKRGDR